MVAGILVQLCKSYVNTNKGDGGRGDIMVEGGVESGLCESYVNAMNKIKVKKVKGDSMVEGGVEVCFSVSIQDFSLYYDNNTEGEKLFC